VVSPVTVYLVVGRRPSGIYVDSAMRATTDTSGSQPLWDLVFEATTAQPGDQVQDRPGGIVLVDRDGEARAIQLVAPCARSLDGAFTHAERMLAADRAEVDRLIAVGVLSVGTVRRIKAPPPPRNNRTFAPDHPLVVPAGESAAPIG
jgi:hypothetical protein